MHLTLLALALALLVALEAIVSVEAALYVINPQEGSTCHGGEECTVEWLDDGSRPLLSTIGVATIGLYTGNQQLVQRIDAVDVSKVQSLRFTPIPGAGPDSDAYYIAFSSTTFSENGTEFLSFSPFFKLDQMSGSFSSALDSATSSLEIPSSLTASTDGTASSTPLSTITVGTLSTSLPPLETPTSAASSTSSTETSSSTTLSITSGFSTLTIPSSTSSTIANSNTATGTAPGASAPSQSSNSASSTRGVLVSLPLFGVLSFSYILLCYL
ncbi:hypothetical protein V5O48_011313 [Marasmius crinis-equi]|uniref:Yeast cell wall synthesis Kre9/Knh1-like N-terminal domain-containing protein n=1 Tax=Marasmius crinis-equi TaxID=585013 RepID=A0ABR3F5Z7_9AGAR